LAPLGLRFIFAMGEDLYHKPGEKVARDRALTES